MRRAKPIHPNEMALLGIIAAASIVTKPYVRSVFTPLGASLGIPTGVFAGTVYMFWLALANHLVNKAGSVLKLCFVQAVLAILLGMSGRSGALTILTYVLPGVAMEGLFVGLSVWWRYCRCNPVCSALGTGVANAVGAMLTAGLVMGASAGLALLTVPPSFISGGLGGVFGWAVGRRIEHAMRLLRSRASEQAVG